MSTGQDYRITRLLWAILAVQVITSAIAIYALSWGVVERNGAMIRLNHLTGQMQWWANGWKP